MSEHGRSRRAATAAGVAFVVVQAMVLAMPGGATGTAAGGGKTPGGSGRQATPTGLALFTVPPCRVLDTRESSPLSPGTYLFQVSGTCAIPAGAAAVSANLTVVGPQAPGYLTVFAGNASLPGTSNLNFNANQARANSAVVQLAGDGTIDVFYRSLGADTATVELILDVNGFFESTGTDSGKVIIDSLDPAMTAFDFPVTVAISGQGFAAPVAVSLAGVTAQVVSTSATKLKVLARLPLVSGCSNVQGPVHVTNLGSGDSADGPQFTYVVPKPVVAGVMPPAGSQFGGTMLTISGDFLNPQSTQVQFGPEAPLPATGWTASTLLVTTPPFTGTFQTQPCTTGSGLPGVRDLPTSVDVTVTDTITGCASTVNGAFTYLPANSSCRVSAPPIAAFIFFTSSGSELAIFTDTSTGAPTTWSWTFGDGTGSSAQNPAHTYATAGTFEVTLTACNVAGCSVASSVVTVPGT